MRIFCFIILASVPLLLAAADRDFRGLCQAGDKAFKSGKYQDALEDFRLALDKSPNGWNDNRCISMIGHSLLNLKRYEEAIEWYKRISELPDINDNTRARHYEMLGEVYFRQKKLEEAKECFLLCLAQSDDTRTRIIVQEKLARLYRRLGQNDAAIRCYKDAAGPADPYYSVAISARRQLAELYLSRKQYQQVLDLFKSVNCAKYPNKREKQQAEKLIRQATTGKAAAKKAAAKKAAEKKAAEKKAATK